MLATLLIWAYSFTIFYIYGYGGLIFLKKIFHLQDGIALSFPIIAIMGAAVLTTLASFLVPHYASRRRGHHSDFAWRRINRHRQLGHGKIFLFLLIIFWW